MIRKWTKYKLKKNALKYQSRSEWVQEDPAAYHGAYRRKILDECCAHMTAVPDKNPHGYWTLEKCQAAARRYDSPGDWLYGDHKSYTPAHRNEWLEVCCAHMEVIIHEFPCPRTVTEEMKKMVRGERRGPKKKWTLEKLKAIGSRYGSKAGWRKGNRRSYDAAWKDKWFDECCAHMAEMKEWTREECMAEALKYKSQKDWKRGSPHSHRAALDNTWFDNLWKFVHTYGIEII